MPATISDASGHKPEQAVLEQRINEHQQQADKTGQQAHLQLLRAEGCRDLLLRLDAETNRQRTVFELVGQGFSLVLSKVTGDL